MAETRCRTPPACVDIADLREREVFDFQVDPVAHTVALFELHFPRPPQGLWRERFDIRVDVRFAYVDLEFGSATVRVSARGARLSSRCTGCHLLPHSLYGLLPLPARSVVAVQETETAHLNASAAAEVKVDAGLLRGVDVSSSIGGKATAQTGSKIGRHKTRRKCNPGHSTTAWLLGFRRATHAWRPSRWRLPHQPWAVPRRALRRSGRSATCDSRGGAHGAADRD
jgi:hypothetical protein